MPNERASRGGGNRKKVSLAEGQTLSIGLAGSPRRRRIFMRRRGGSWARKSKISSPVIMRFNRELAVSERGNGIRRGAGRLCTHIKGLVGRRKEKKVGAV